MKTFKQVIEKKEIPKGYHRMPDGTLMKDSDHPKKVYKASYEDIEDTKEGLSPEQKRARKLKKMNAHLRKTMAKYRAASKAGIHPSRVHQRRTSLTLKKR